MPSTNFLTFRTFSDQQFAKEFTLLLSEHQIEHVLESSGSNNPLLTAAADNEQFYVKIQGVDFNKAHQALREFYARQVEQVESDYYLFSFTQEELLDLIQHPNDWSDFDYALATKLLKEQGIQEIENTVVLPEEIPQNKRPSFTEEDLMRGIVTSLFGGFMGAWKGWTVLTDTIILPNGEEEHAYSEPDRKRGGTLFAVGGALLFAYVLISIVLIYKAS